MLPGHASSLRMSLPRGCVRTGYVHSTGQRLKVQRLLILAFPLEAECSVGPGELTLLPVRTQKVHKGVGGEVLVIGGGPYQGAPWLAGLGALRAGADIVRIASPLFEPIPDLIYERLEGTRIGEEHKKRLINLAEQADVVICGNGLGDASHSVIHAIAPHCKKAVIDADALRLPLPVERMRPCTRRIPGSLPGLPVSACRIVPGNAPLR